MCQINAMSVGLAKHYQPVKKMKKISFNFHLYKIFVFNNRYLSK
jgi:hypothetical protein